MMEMNSQIQRRGLERADRRGGFAFSFLEKARQGFRGAEYPLLDDIKICERDLYENSYKRNVLIFFADAILILTFGLVFCFVLF